jgi:hypothetical protein
MDKSDRVFDARSDLCRQLLQVRDSIASEARFSLSYKDKA